MSLPLGQAAAGFEAGCNPDGSPLPAGLSVKQLWSEEECQSIEQDIDGIRVIADAGMLKSATCDRTPLRSKYFFGYGYTYGAQVAGKGQEQLLPPEFVDPIPEWICTKLISRLENAEIVPRGWINSAVVNDYKPGGMIVSHIDPKQLFARPIFICTFFAEGRLAFGVRFVFDERKYSSQKSTQPRFIATMPRGTCTLMEGFSADGISHGIRPEDFQSRRVSVVLRHVFVDAPTVTDPMAVLKPAQRGAPPSAARRVGPTALVQQGAGLKRERPEDNDQDWSPSSVKMARVVLPPGGMTLPMLELHQPPCSNGTTGTSIAADLGVALLPGTLPGLCPTFRPVAPASIYADELAKLLGVALQSPSLTSPSNGLSTGTAPAMLNGSTAGMPLMPGLAQVRPAPFAFPCLAGTMAFTQSLPAASMPMLSAVPGISLGTTPLAHAVDGSMASWGQSANFSVPGAGRFLGPGAPTTVVRPRGQLSSCATAAVAPPSNQLMRSAGSLLGLQPSSLLGTQPSSLPHSTAIGEVWPATATVPASVLQVDSQGMPSERHWYYKDMQGGVQGPFVASVMSGWSQQGCLLPETLVRASDEEEFSELGNGLRLLI